LKDKSFCLADEPLREREREKGGRERGKNLFYLEEEQREGQAQGDRSIAHSAGFIKIVPGNHRLLTSKQGPASALPTQAPRSVVIWKNCFLSCCPFFPIITEHERVPWRIE
jgi:hypothetical protein